MVRKTDKEILQEYCQEMEQSYPDGVLEGVMLTFVKRIREDEPRINSGVHLIDYTMICDDDDTMDTFYGPDYFKES